MASAPGMSSMGSRPNKHQMRDFLVAGVEMMESDGTRELLKTCSTPPGKRLIELQRAIWDTLGVDQDLGCKALDEIAPPADDEDDDGGAFELKQEFVWTAMRTYLRALDDKKPAVLETSKPMPREVIVEFFDACNARLDLPETCERLLKFFSETAEREKRGDAIAQMQREQLEILGFEKKHGCAMLEKIPQDFPDDKELQARLQAWYSKAQQSYIMLEQTMIGRRVAEELESNPDMRKAKEAVDKMTPLERGTLIERNAQKVQAIMGMPAAAKQEHMKTLCEADRLELLQAQLIAFSVLKQQAAQMYMQQQHGGSGGPSGTGGVVAPPSQEEMV
mmetsp:Transcript_109683/g.305130  ORF Transcript_109683/g.305130 Transcript_109683/m.305130 type:complete len:334 (+) Transcript_109683:56-1057(+)|eukprot:CAMPEP_0176206106 /NCGR_PEP_ID=MMETSP0121_2-20121125/11937_1 /TAXON_ID=160619 /ORGANISM="Kryptoperidinium foliaceum, Strain CCMP 1326" /LENGTH=333 /DNA_ID=CAMNT_0017545057 /DNA_START=54 /DNA_END=1055 /DNA_ORIENTATION=+